MFEPQFATVQIRVVTPTGAKAEAWPQFIKSKIDLLESVKLYLSLSILSSF